MTLPRGILALAVGLVPAPVFAQTTGSVVVTVLDGDELEVPDAAVALAHPERATIVRCTDAQGTAVFEDQPAGASYSVEVASAAGVARIEGIAVRERMAHHQTLVVFELEWDPHRASGWSKTADPRDGRRVMRRYRRGHRALLRGELPPAFKCVPTAEADLADPGRPPG